MKILIVTHYFRPHIGGIEIVAYNQAKGLVKLGNNVTIVTSRLGHEPSSENIEGINIIRIKALNFLEKYLDVPFPIFLPGILSILINEVRKNDIVHVHGCLYLGSLIATICGKIYKKPVFLTEHVGHINYKNSFLNVLETLAFFTIGKITLSLSNKTIVLNESVKKYLSNISKGNKIILPNGVDTFLFHPVSKKEVKKLRKKYNLSQNKPLVLFVGRFVQKKGIDMLLKAKSSLFDIVCVGSGDIYKYTNNLNGIHIYNDLDQHSLAEIYQVCDIFILPSRGEGFPLSIQEAMASNLPVITTKENIPFEKNKELAFYVLPKSNEINSAIRKILENPYLAKRIVKESRAFVLKEFSWSRYVEKLLEIYKEYKKFNNKLIFTTSWDDGHVLDLKLAKLLKKYNIAATFYISPNNHEFSKKNLLSDKEIKTLSKDFEIGAHTMTHPHLTKISKSRIDYEIKQSKIYLEQIIDKTVSAFCYPYGDYNYEVESLVKNNGFKLARTTKRYSFSSGNNFFELPTTFHAYNHFTDIRKIVLFGGMNFGKTFSYKDWDKLAIDLIDFAHNEGENFHLWGHSWELEKYNGWNQLENVFKYVTKRREVVFKTNSELIL